MLPKFDIELVTVKQNLVNLLEKNKQTIDNLVKTNNPTWESLLQPLDELAANLEEFWAPISHLNSVCNNEELRKVYDTCLPILTDYSTHVGHNVKLYNAIKQIPLTTCDNAQKKIIRDALLDFELSGVALNTEKKVRFKEIERNLSDLSNKFSNNIIDATKAQQFQINDVTELEGLPEHVLDTARNLAEQQNKTGWILTLEAPCYIAIMTHATNRNLREKFYAAYTTRASDQGEFGSEHLQFDNTIIMQQILDLRQEKAQLLGYKNYAELSLVTKMANSPVKVLSFLEDLRIKSFAAAKNDFKLLEQIAQEKNKIAIWDLAYLSEKLRQLKYDISEEELRQYFPLSKVVQGLSELIYDLFAVNLKLIKDVVIWHPDVQCYQVLQNNNCLGYIYCDFFARPNKKNGAWMDSLQTYYKKADGSVQLPIATLTCNFTKTQNSQEPLLSHEEVETLFHEMGHVLHHILTKVDYYSASGIQGVEWDAVELPSQFLENWCWDRNILKKISRHAKTQQVLPDNLIHKLIESRKFQAGLAMLRQLQFAIFDLRLHLEYNQQANFMRNLINEVRKQTSIIDIPEYNRFENSFSHIFAGGYAAGYYSYKWAEVLSCDIYEYFVENLEEINAIGARYLHEIISRGSSRTTEENFEAFMQRPPQVDALLKQYDLI
jgi:oligopeptidase A